MVDTSTLHPDEPADSAIPKLVAEHGGTIYRIGLRLCGHPEEAEELTQETFINAWRGWQGFEGRAKPTTWLYTIAARACQRRKRRKVGEPERVESLEALTDAVTPSASVAGDPAGTLDRREVAWRVDRAIGHVPEPFRLPLVLKDIAGLSLREIGEALGVKPATVKTRVHRGRLRLREALDDGAGDGGPPGAICRALLEARQEALDRGAPFEVPEETIDERCRTMLQQLTQAHERCGEMAAEGLPEDVRQRILRACREA